MFKFWKSALFFHFSGVYLRNHKSLSITHFANKQNPSKLDENNRVQILKFPSNLQYGPICVKNHNCWIIIECILLKGISWKIILKKTRQKQIHIQKHRKHPLWLLVLETYRAAISQVNPNIYSLPGSVCLKFRYILSTEQMILQGNHCVYRRATTTDSYSVYKLRGRL